MLVAPVAQRRAVDELHHHEAQAFRGRAGLVATDDVGMVDAGENLGLALEPGLELLALQVAGEDLYRGAWADSGDG